jgi:hypothetical protein
MAEVHRDVDGARTLASGAYQDVGDMRAMLRGQTKSLEALNENQRELQGDVRELDAKVEREFADVRGEMREGFTKVNLGMSQITALLTSIIDEEKKSG